MLNVSSSLHDVVDGAHSAASKVAVALANKMARIAWAVLSKGELYRAPTRSRNAVVPKVA